MDDWIRLITGTLPASEAGALLSPAVTGLDSILKTRPQAEQQILDIIRGPLSTATGATTWGTILRGLTTYLDQDQAYLILWLAQVDPSKAPEEASNRIGEVEKYASPRVSALLRLILALRAQDLARAFTVWNQLPHDWYNVTREVYFDMIYERYYLKVRIDKYNGEQPIIEGTADSLLNLVALMLRTCTIVNDRKAFTESTVRLFEEEADSFRKVWQAPEEAVSQAGS